MITIIRRKARDAQHVHMHRYHSQVPFDVLIGTVVSLSTAQADVASPISDVFSRMS